MFSGVAIAAALTSAPVDAGAIRAVDVGADSVTVHFDGPVGRASAFALDAPGEGGRRLALDVTDAQTRGADRRTVDNATVAGVRQAQFAPDTARVVLDLKAPAVITAGRFTADGAALTLSLRPVDAGAFAAAVARGRRGFDAPVADMAARPQSRQSITVAIPPPSRGLTLPRVEGPAGAPLVVIDAGHGGHDPGALNRETGAREKDVTLGVATAIRDALLKGGRVRVALTRENDRFLVLQERYGIARRLNADLFISIHADAAENEAAHGASVYTLSEVASDREAARLAARENKADIINGVNLGDQSSDVSSILIDLTQRESMNISAGFARLLQREAAPRMPFRDNFHRFASLVVLKAPDIPSVLFETGYITNADDVRFLTARDGQRRIAEGVASAVEVHFARRLASR